MLDGSAAVADIDDADPGVLIVLLSMRMLTDNVAHRAILATDIASSVHVLAMASGCVGGMMHGIAMAVRKQYGQGHAYYWLQWRWWLGTSCDGIAGLFIMPAMPFVSVQILMPLIVVVQMLTSYSLGLFFFREKATSRHHLGVICAVAGVIGLGLASPLQASDFSISSFWAYWLRTPFLISNLVSLLALATLFAVMHRSTFWGMAAGFSEAVQYVCTRALADAAFEFNSVSAMLVSGAVWAAAILKILCIVFSLHFQQKGLESDLSRFAGIYLVGSTLFICVYGAVYFSDHIPLSWTFFSAATSTLAGIWLLNGAEHLEGEEQKLINPEKQDSGEAYGH